MHLVLIIILSIVIGLVVLLCLLFIFAKRWAKKKKNKLEHRSKIASTPKGEIEYIVLGEGEGIPLLIFHGAPGGYDQGFLMKEFVEKGFKIVAFSRPGYLRTPLNGNRDYTKQAELAFSLLEYLQISNCVVVGLSAGGPIALRFVLQFPSRVIALILMSAVTKKYIPKDYQSNSLLGKIYLSNLGGDLFGFLLSLTLNMQPDRVLKSFLKIETTFSSEKINTYIKQISKTSDQMNWFKALVRSTFPLSIRNEGLKNDIKMLSEIEPLPLEKIEKPILVIHSKYDGDVEFSHALNVMERNRHAQLFESQGLGHLVWLGPDRTQMYQKVYTFIEKQTSERP
ncbi:MAG: hypothetical protein BAJALOKI1v1_440010 [Promethearchaeota archaeon]|nr:MAG: hypothetical protein BAJALOKI1v1_440010 [Candidatus Lokiarchaeota archaeon]